MEQMMTLCVRVLGTNMPRIFWYIQFRAERGHPEWGLAANIPRDCKHRVEITNLAREWGRLRALTARWPI